MTTLRLVAAASILLAAPAWAATGPASLACTLKARTKGKPAGDPAETITLKGLIPATAPGLDLTLTWAAHSLVMNAEAHDRVAVIDAFADRVFALVIVRREGPPLRLYARPSTIKVRRAAHAVHARFDAVLLEAPAVPGAKAGAPEAPSGRVLACLYDYEV